jgi:hypothetical protein
MTSNYFNPSFLRSFPKAFFTRCFFLKREKKTKKDPSRNIAEDLLLLCFQMWRAGGQGSARLACRPPHHHHYGGGARLMCGDVLPLQAADHRRRGCGGLLLRFTATSTRTTPATATATLKKSEMVRRAITGRPGATAGVLAEDMEGAVGAVGRLLASPHARDQEAGRALATDLLARQPLPPIGGGAPTALLASARCSPSVLQAIAANSPTEVRTPTPSFPLLLLRRGSGRVVLVVVVVVVGLVVVVCVPVVVMAGAHRSFLLLTHGSGHAVQALAVLKRMERR